MRQDEFRHLQIALASLQSSTRLVARYRALQVTWQGRRSPYISHQEIEFADAADLGELFYLADDRHAVVVMPQWHHGDPAAVLREIEADDASVTVFAGEIPVHLFGRRVTGLPSHDGLAGLLATVFPVDDIDRMVAASAVLRVASTRPRLLAWQPDGLPLLASRHRADAAVIAHAVAAQVRAHWPAGGHWEDPAVPDVHFWVASHVVNATGEIPPRGVDACGTPAFWAVLDGAMRAPHPVQLQDVVADAIAALVPDPAPAPVVVPDAPPAAPLSIAGQLRAALARDAEDEEGGAA